MNEISTRELTKMALLVALLCVSAYIVIPLPFTPAMIVATTLVFNLAAFLLTPRQTFIVALVYTFIGAIGLPVFSGGTGGFGKLFGPTGGFIWAFIVAYPVVSYLKGPVPSFKRYSLVSILVGIPLTYVGGVAGMMFFLDLDLWAALVAGAFPFIPGDILKCVIAAYIAVKMRF